MKVKTVVEISSAQGVIPSGQIIDIPLAILEKLKGKVTPLTDGRELSTFCSIGDAWCSAKIGLGKCFHCGGEKQ